MRIYAILVYIILFSLVLGFVNVAINEPMADGNSIFLPEAQGIITFPTTGMFTQGLQQVANATEQLTCSTNVIEGIFSLANVVWSGGYAVMTFLFSVFSTMPNLVLTVAGWCGIQLPDAFIYILTVGLMLATVYSAFQIFTGKWFSFVE